MELDEGRENENIDPNRKIAEISYQRENVIII